MSHEHYSSNHKDSDDDYDNEVLDELSDDYDDDERYNESETRRSHNYSGSGGHNYDLSDDSRVRKDHHNQLERKRRASIKSSYTELREAIPNLKDNKASRSVILQKAVEYLEDLHRRNSDHVACVEHFQTENANLETKCREMEIQVQMLLQMQRNAGVGTTVANGSNVNTGMLGNNSATSIDRINLISTPNSLLPGGGASSTSSNDSSSNNHHSSNGTSNNIRTNIAPPSLTSSSSASLHSEPACNQHPPVLINEIELANQHNSDVHSNNDDECNSTSSLSNGHLVPPTINAQDNNSISSSPPNKRTKL